MKTKKQLKFMNPQKTMPYEINFTNQHYATKYKFNMLIRTS